MVCSKADTRWVEICIHNRPNDYFIPSLSFSNNQLVYLSICTKLSNYYKNESHNAKLYVAQYNGHGRPLSHDIALGNMRVKHQAVPLNTHAKVVYDLIINWDQTDIKYIPVSDWMMEKVEAKIVEIRS